MSARLSETLCLRSLPRFARASLPRGEYLFSAKGAELILSLWATPQGFIDIKKHPALKARFIACNSKFEEDIA